MLEWNGNKTIQHNASSNIKIKAMATYIFSQIKLNTNVIFCYTIPSLPHFILLMLCFSFQDTASPTFCLYERFQFPLIQFIMGFILALAYVLAHCYGAS